MKFILENAVFLIYIPDNINYFNSMGS